MTVGFITLAVTITVTKNGSPLTTGLVSHAGNTGAFGPVRSLRGHAVLSLGWERWWQASRAHKRDRPGDH